jgi:hypothetical protein
MFTKYSDFLFESIVLESVVVYSDKFKNLLKEIDSPVATALLDLQSKDLDLANNYLDVLDKEQISFILDRKAKELLQTKDKFATYNGGTGFLKHSPGNTEIFELLEYEPVGDSTYHPNSGERGEVLKMVKSPTSDNIYVKIKFPGGITAINKSNLDFEDVELLPFKQNRQPIRIGRGIRALLAKTEYKFTDSEIEQFVNKYKSAWDAFNDIFRKFELVSGNDIAIWYNYKKYAAMKHTLGSSCMRSVDKEYFDIYIKNPDKCSLLILKADDDNFIKGRALVWKLDKPNVTFMDRIYTNADSDVELFKQYAHKNGWYHKPDQSSSNDSEIVGKDGKLDQEELTVQLNDSYRRYPYLDTLKYFNTYTNLLTTKENHDGSWITLEDTGGYWSEYNSCDNCGGDGRVDCYECDGSGRVPCGDCYSRSLRRSTGTESCGNCSGDGEIECSDCRGACQIDGQDCEECNGGGRVTCNDCNGDGELTCSGCDGNRTLECGECDGDGRRDCPECS